MLVHDEAQAMPLVGKRSISNNLHKSKQASTEALREEVLVLVGLKVSSQLAIRTHSSCGTSCLK